MSIMRGSTSVSAIYKGAEPIVRVYRGQVLVWPTSGTPSGTTSDRSLVFDFAAGSVPVGATITRSGKAWRWNEQKVLVTVPPNAGRIDYDGETGTLLGLLVEPAATNLLAWGRRLNRGVAASEWAATDVTVADDVAGRDGGPNTASTLRAGVAGATFLAAKIASLNDYTFSAWVRRKSGYGRIDITVDGGASWIEMTAHFLGREWVRIGSHLLGVGARLADPRVGFRFDEGGDEIEVDLCQLEEGPVATSEIPTEGAAVSRSAETLRCTSIAGAGAGYGYTFGWPPAARLRNGRWLRRLDFSNVMTERSLDAAISYSTDELGRPRYTQTVASATLTL